MKGETVTDTINTANGTIDDLDFEMPAAAIHVPRIAKAELTVRIDGITPLIVHSWSEKAKQEMRDRQQGKAKEKLPPKDPVADYNGSRYIIDKDRDGVPAAGIKAAIVGACSQFDKRLTKVLMKQVIFVHGETTEMLVPIIGKPEMREDMVRVGQGTSDIRYRAQYWPWSMNVTIEFKPRIVTAETVLALLDAAGDGGICEWRPSAPKSMSGNFGRFVVSDNEILGLN